MKVISIAALLIGTCAGCYSLPLRTPACHHTDQATYEFKSFADGHHYLFGKDSKLAASVNTKDGFLSGKFEIYYDTGILKYWGVLDDRGHVVSGKYNTYHLAFNDYDIRTMTVADEQNAQSELADIMRYGIVKDSGTTNSTPNVYVKGHPVKTTTLKGASSAPSGDITNTPANEESCTPSLLDCTRSDFRPEEGAVYEHDGHELVVFQALEGGALVRKSDFNYNRIDIAVETSKGYVDNEMLAPGRYEYIGPWTYETIEKRERTIRRFKQVK